MNEEAYLNTLCLNARVDFHNLLNKEWNLAVECSKKFGENDARFMFLQNYAALNVWLLITLDVFIEMLDPNDTRLGKYVINPDPKTRVQYLVTHDKFNRISYSTNTMFWVEDFIKNLMKGLQIQPKGKYFDFTKDLLKFLGITDPQKHLILNAPYQLRNSLHNNGYAHHDFSILLRGNQYSFEKGKQIRFAGWNHLHIFFDELVDLLIEVVKNPSVEKITTISHTYDLVT